VGAAWRDGGENLERSAYRDVIANKRTICLVGRQSPERTLVFSNLLTLDQDNRASDVLATLVLSIDVPSTRHGANVRVHDTIPVNDDGKR
jgi:hypothetical protein